MDSIQELDVQDLPSTDTDSNYVAATTPTRKRKQFDQYYADADVNDLVFPESLQDKCVCFAVGYLGL